MITTDNTSAVQGQWKEKIFTVNSESVHMSILYIYIYIFFFFFFGENVWIEPREEQEWKVKGFGELFRWR